MSRMLRLVERIRAAASTSTNSFTISTAQHNTNNLPNNVVTGQILPTSRNEDFGVVVAQDYSNGTAAASSDFFGAQVVSPPVSDFTTDYYNFPATNCTDGFQSGSVQVSYADFLTSPTGYFNNGLDFQAIGQQNLSVNLFFLQGPSG
ncbi:uncharacterized protein LOC122058712 [Macadamia integrifolia]|uniref:uncharacterized protein LOC122058712 n=1 Tax=Macadamia integrifolia TaxID=60698 RepID=UPI001C4EDE8C|nr:uncharacterized protein LOC122058712 [Macadamia integrifolia]